MALDADLGRRPGARRAVPKKDQARYHVEIDDTIDQYIREAAIPPRTRGFDWFLQLPQGMTLDDVDAQLNEGVSLGESKAPALGEVLAVFRHEASNCIHNELPIRCRRPNSPAPHPSKASRPSTFYTDSWQLTFLRGEVVAELK